MEIVIGIIGVILGFLIVIYRVRIREFMGQIGWAEKHLGAGGTYTALLLIGIAIFFVSLMIMTGTLGFLIEPFSSLFVIRK